MTAPLSFANIQAPQLAPQQSAIGDLPQLILQIAEHRDAVRNQAQQLALEKQRTEASVAASGAATAESKQDLKDKQLAYDTKQKSLQAHDIVANELPGVLTQPGDFTANAEAARVKLIQQNKQLAPFINDAFNAQVSAIAESRTKIAQSRIEAANAPVAEQTAAPKIVAAKLAADQAGVSLADSKVEAAIHKLQLSSFGDQQQRQGAALFDTLLNQGLNAGQISDLTHTPLPPSIPRDYTRAPKGNANQQAVIASDMATAMGVANAAIKASKSQGLALPGLISATTGSTIMQYLSNSASSAEQQGLANNYLLYAQGLNHLVNSARASDKDFVRIMRTVTTYANEAPAIAGQKAVMRDLLPSLFQANAKGVPQSTALSNVIDAARKQGVSQSILAPFISLKLQLSSAEASPNDTTSRNQQLLDGVIKP